MKGKVEKIAEVAEKEDVKAAAKEYLDNVKENCNKIEFSIRKEALDEKKKVRVYDKLLLFSH